MKITKCPICGSRKIKRVRRDVTVNIGALDFVTPDVQFDECSNCGEQLFDLVAMEKIENHRPVVKARRRKIA